MTSLVISCNQVSKKELNKEEITDKTPVKNNEFNEISTTINNKSIDWNKFQNIYAYVDTENEFKQILGINYINPDSISFQLVCCSMMCEMELSGNAKNLNPNGDQEIDEDENGAYPVDEFIFETNEYVVSIRIDSETKTKSRFIFTPNGEADPECDPRNELIMKKNAR